MHIIVRRRGVLVLVAGLVSALCLIACLESQAATWSRIISGGYHTWYLDGSQKFQWQESNGQWWHYSNLGSSWYALSSTGLTSTFIGTGSWYDLGNGFMYQYLSTPDYGYFKDGASYRFRYRYTQGQWDHTGDTMSWQLLGASGRTAAFLGNGGGWYDLGNGFTYWYYAASHSGYFRYNGKNRFFYRYASGQWNHTGDTASWQALGASGSSAAFLGSGAWYDVGNGFTYRYLSSHDYGYFNKDGSYRFYYRYGPGQWYHTGVAVASWQALGASGRTAAFLGNGGSTWHDLGNGFTFWYHAGSDVGYFRRNGKNRFMYRYVPGQWNHAGNDGSWQVLGTSGRSAAFLGSGSTWYDLGNGFTYWYYAGSDSGYFRRNGKNRFFYRYTSGQWNHTGDIAGWQLLGEAGATAAFVGDGTRRSLGYWQGRNWYYLYNASADRADWYRENDTTSLRFSYAYGDGQWRHHGWSTGESVLSSPMSLSSLAFIGDGEWHQVSDTPQWHYIYLDFNDTGYYGLLTDGNYFERFAYEYDSGQWSHNDTWNLTWLPLGSPASLTDVGFMGDGVRRQVLTGLQPWWYRYDYATDRGEYYRTDETAGLRFSYGYFLGDWYHYSWDGGWGMLGSASLSDAKFDGTWWLTDSTSTQPWYFSYNYGTDTGSWSLSAGDANTRFTYAYANGQWKHRGGDAVEATALGSPRGLTWDDSFLGDGTRRDVTTGADTWWYRYDYGNDRGQWYTLDDDASARFAYSYGKMQWNFWEQGNTWTAIGSTGRQLDFIGDGARHTLVDSANWKLMYLYGANDLRIIHNGEASDTTFNFVGYSFGSGWWYDSYDNAGAQALYQMSGYWLGSNNATNLVFSKTGGYEMDYDLAGTAAERFARYSQSGTNSWKYIYATQTWYSWSGTDWVLDATGTSELHRP